MNESAVPIEERTLQFGLLMESAQAHQRMAEAHLENLRVHTRGLDAVVREEIRRTLVEELRAVTEESAAAARALQTLQRTAHLRAFGWNVAIAVLCSAIPAGMVHFMLPTEGEITALRVRRDALAEDVSRLERHGARGEWRSCGDPGRLCVRVDRRAPAYGADGDYLVVKGY